MVDPDIIKALTYIASGTGLIFLYLSIREHIKTQGIRRERERFESQLETFLAQIPLYEQSILKPCENNEIDYPSNYL
jgi:hypothetical protein